MKLLFARCVRVHLALIAGAAWTAGCGDNPSEHLPALELGSSSPVPSRSTRPADTTSPLEPCLDGDTEVCSRHLSSDSGVASCFVGVRTCQNGQWQPCEPTACVDPPPSQLSQTLAGTLALGSSCQANPCDPHCGSKLDAPDSQPVPTVVGESYSIGSIEHLPGGFQKKGLKDSAHPPSSACIKASDCQFDHYCDTSSGLCVPWGPGQVDPSCSGVDLTATPTCNGTIAVCNRGATTAPANLQVTVFDGNQNQLQSDLGKCDNFDRTSSNHCYTDRPLEPGQCINVTGCTLGGTKSLVVNPPASLNYGNYVAECECGNNWSTYHNGGACQEVGVAQYAPLTIYKQYEAVCGPGRRPFWNYLLYDADTPSNASGSSSVQIRAQTADYTEELAAGCGDCTTVASLPSPDPTSCQLFDPSPCPLDLFNRLGGLPHAVRFVIQLEITLTPTPDRALAPELREFELMYSCQDTE